MKTIPRIDAEALLNGEAGPLEAVRAAALDVGFMVLDNTPFAAERMQQLIETYRAFFHLPDEQKAAVDMAETGSNRGWGGMRSERVDPESNPDLKEVFDCGFEWAEAADAGAPERYYAANLWPEAPEGFREEVEGYYREALGFCRRLLGAISEAIGEDRSYFQQKFVHPMALLRANFYPARPAWAGEKDFGIAPHTDYGCLTLLATDGAPGLEVLRRDGEWEPVAAAPGAFVVNFGEMLEMWSGGQVKATLHRVRGGTEERISIPLFFNPEWDADVAPQGAGVPIRAGEHLSKRYDETYLHMGQHAGRAAAG
ncbi:isopenicillin N synthase family dioxygenase [Vannielia litorea]|uniref:isopenicillin N synthase family dioxygenase n=1 Tax=Vannielia litorea TaxID=1217970 RepID=UPI001BCB512C|nr:2OG-Fe(II) oxygenase family protein [Vannielia litorea]MBS8229079.1 isopenicillin N synthase family oxygenase [Vannielia litorea]